MKKLLSVILIFSLVFTSNSFAAAVAPSNMQTTVSNVIQLKMASRGIAANDAKINTTLAYSSNVLALAATGAAVVAGVATAPAWGTLAAILTVGSILVSGVAWLYNSDGTVAIGGGSAPVGAAISAGDLVFHVMRGDGVHLYSSDAVSLWKDFMTYQYGGYGALIFAPYSGCTGAGSDQAICLIVYVYSAGNSAYINGVYTANYTQANYAQGWNRSANVPVGTPTCSVGYLTGTTCAVPASSSSTPPPKTVTEAVADLTPAQKAAPVDNQFIADLINKTLAAAAVQPGYAGYVPDVASPVTAADVAAVQALNPNAYPTVGDVFAPQPAPLGGTAADPWQLPQSALAPAASPAINPSATPAAAPVAGLDFVVPTDTLTIPKLSIPISYVPTIFAAPTGCPAPIQFVMFGKNYDISWTPMCNLMSSVAPIFLAIGAATAALIFASALTL